MSVIEVIVEEESPLMPVYREQINDVWRNCAKGYNPYDYFGVYHVAPEDIFWRDKA
jgi:hypothetical protein